MSLMSPTNAEQRPVTQQDLQALVKLLEYHQGGLVGLLTVMLKVQLVSLLVVGLLLVLILCVR